MVISLKRGCVVKPLPSKASIWIVILAVFPGVWIIPAVQAIARGHWSQVTLIAILAVLGVFSGGLLFIACWIWGVCYAASGHHWAKDYLLARGWRVAGVKA